MKQKPSTQPKIVAIYKIVKRNGPISISIFPLSLFFYFYGNRLEFLPNNWTKNVSLFRLNILDFLVKTLVTIICWKIMYLWMEDLYSAVNPFLEKTPNDGTGSSGGIPPEPESSHLPVLDSEQTQQDPGEQSTRLEDPTDRGEFWFRDLPKREWTHKDYLLSDLSEKIAERFEKQNPGVSLNQRQYDDLTQLLWDRRKLSSLHPSHIKPLLESFRTDNAKGWQRYSKIIRKYNTLHNTNYNKW